MEEVAGATPTLQAELSHLRDLRRATRVKPKWDDRFGVKEERRTSSPIHLRSTISAELRRSGSAVLSSSLGMSGRSSGEREGFGGGNRSRLERSGGERGRGRGWDSGGGAGGSAPRPAASSLPRHYLESRRTTNDDQMFRETVSLNFPGLDPIVLPVPPRLPFFGGDHPNFRSGPLLDPSATVLDIVPGEGESHSERLRRIEAPPVPLVVRAAGWHWRKTQFTTSSFSDKGESSSTANGCSPPSLTPRRAGGGMDTTSGDGETSSRSSRASSPEHRSSRLPHCDEESTYVIPLDEVSKTKLNRP